MMSANCCCVIDGEEVLEAREAWPKYWLIVTPVPVTQTWPGCSGQPIVVFKMSSSPYGTKLPYIACSSKESYMHTQFMKKGKNIVHCYDTII